MKNGGIRTCPLIRVAVGRCVRLLVFGGTKGVGRLFVQGALDNGHEVTLFARDPPASKTPPQPGLRIIKGDANDKRAVQTAVPGHDAVLVSLGPSGTERFQHFIGPATAWIVEAMEKEGVPRLLFMSGLGVGESRRDAPGFMRWFVVPLLLRPTFTDRADAEEHVKRSRVDWTIVRPLYLTDDPPTGRWNATPIMKAVRDGIPRADVAQFLLDELNRREYVRRAVALETR